MESRLSKVKSIILDLLSDGAEHSSDELRKGISENGLALNPKDSVLRTALYQLRNSGVIHSRDRGVYQICSKENIQSVLKDFTTLVPEQKIPPMCIYVHDDGSLVLNSKLNQEIKSRTIEIKLHSNGSKIALIPDGEICHKFTKSGRTKNIELVKILKNKRISFPATFEIVQDVDLGVWIGDLHKNTKSKKNTVHNTTSKST